MYRARQACSLLLLACLGAAPSQADTPPAVDSDAIWAHFENWVRTSPASSVRPAKPLMEVYTGKLVTEGVSREEAERRVKLITTELRPKSRRHNMVYWDAMFKFGGGPDRPLAVLGETARAMPPGSALDVAMGNGRNSVYLASLGWKATGYDISPEGLRLAREHAAQMKVDCDIVQAGHREFDFGVERWDLIVLSYIVADQGDLEAVFGEKMWRSLRPAGRLVCEGSFCESLVQHVLTLKLPGLRLERYSDADEVRDGWPANDLKGRVIRAIIRKLP
jgi:SAM-dependent methyltransferase